jgi:hypothetical protein
MPADRDDDDTPADEPKSSRGPKKRFQERDDKDKDDDDRPRKKRSRDDDEDAPRSKRRADDDADDAPRKKRRDDDDADDAPKKRRRAADDGPRVKSNDNIPIVMLLAFIGSAVALLVICGGCGWWSFDWLVGGGEGFAGGGTEFEVTSASRTPGIGAFGAPSVNWAVTQKQTTSTGAGQYYVIIKCGTAAPIVKQIYPNGKGWTQSGGGTELGLRGTSGKTEVWVEKRPNPVATGKVVSNVYVIP